MITAALTEELELLEIRYSASTIGVSVPYYVPVETIAASITTQRGGTTFNQGENYTDNISFYARYTPEIRKKGFVIRYNNEIYTISNVTHKQTEATIIDCKATT